jgi:hypothetical protein
MKVATRLRKLEEKVSRVKSELLNIGEMRPGSLSTQYNVCSSPGCKCKRKQNPIRHGPYYQISYTHRGRSTTQAVLPILVVEVRRQLQTFKKFRKLVDIWTTLALEHATLRMQVERKRSIGASEEK